MTILYSNGICDHYAKRTFSIAHQQVHFVLQKSKKKHSKDKYFKCCKSDQEENYWTLFQDLEDVCDYNTMISRS